MRLRLRQQPMETGPRIDNFFTTSIPPLCRGSLGSLHRRHRAEGDGKPVPGVDGRDQHGQVHRLGLRELRADLGIDVVGRMRFGDQRHGFGPGERRAFALAIDRRFAPGVQEIEPLLGLSALARILGVHVDAVGAAVDR